MTDRITDLERRYVGEVLDSDFRSSAGSAMTARLERAFADRFDSRFAIAFVNGTTTMHAALAAWGVGPGDEVIVPPLTMSSTAFAVVHAGAVPVFADVDVATFNIDPADVERHISERTRAVIPVALYGLSPDLDPLMELAARHDLFVLEDDAECFGGRYGDRIVGSIGHAASFSFQSSKHLTAGEGGMIVTDDETLAGEIRRFGSLGYKAVAPGKPKITKDDLQDPGYERHASVGFNYRMPELCAAVALAQLERMDELVACRTTAGRLLEQATASCDWLVPQHTPEGYEHSYWTFVARLEADAGLAWRDFRSAFVSCGGHGMYAAWQLSYLEPAFRGVEFAPDQSQRYERGLCPVAESVQPWLLQFKTNYWRRSDAEQQAEALAKTIAELEGRDRG